MKMFSNMTTDGLEEAGDRLGPGGLIDTGIYEGTVKLAFAGSAQSSKAQSITIHIDINGFEFRETFWVTNRDNENFYVDKKDPNKKHPLPGFQMVDELCLVTTGYPLTDQDFEEKVVQLYDYEKKKDAPQNVPVLINLLGKPVRVAVVKQVVDKQKKNDAGVYVNTGETREENVADKFFHQESLRTVSEIRNGAEEATFHDAWKTKNAGKTRNRAKGAQGNSGTPGRPGAAAGGTAAAQKPKTSLFGAK